MSETASDPADFEKIPLDEFCSEVSLSDRRVELIAVFAFRERSAGTTHDTRAQYRARYDATAGKSV